MIWDSSCGKLPCARLMGGGGGGGGGSWQKILYCLIVFLLLQAIWNSLDGYYFLVKFFIILVENTIEIIIVLPLPLEKPLQKILGNSLFFYQIGKKTKPLKDSLFSEEKTGNWTNTFFFGGGGIPPLDKNQTISLYFFEGFPYCHCF